MAPSVDGKVFLLPIKTSRQIDEISNPERDTKPGETGLYQMQKSD
jgi:hypothetical protein